MRLSEEELEKVKEKYGVSRLWSWSRVNTFMNSKYEYFLKHVLDVEEDRCDCIYTTTGSISHDVLEKYYNNRLSAKNIHNLYEGLFTQQIERTEMGAYFEDGWNAAVDIAELKFDRNDEEHNKKLAEKYYIDLKHFFKTHTPIKYDVITEQFVTAKIGDYILQGYIDAIFKDSNDIYHIIDFKTSSIYKGKTLEEKSGQLCVYCMGLMQLGIPLDKIKIAFNFLKYVTVEYTQANGETKTRDVERCKIGESLQSNAKMWLKKLGYTDKMDEYLKEMIDLNDISVLPEDVQVKFKITDCYVYIPLTQKLLDSWIDFIVANIKDIELREKDYAESKNERLFWDSEGEIKKQSYYFAVLCSYSPSLHKPYSEYLSKLEESQNGSNIFDGIGGSVDDSVDLISEVASKNDNKNDIDLSWLDEI